MEKNTVFSLRGVLSVAGRETVVISPGKMVRAQWGMSGENMSPTCLLHKRLAHPHRALVWLNEVSKFRARAELLGAREGTWSPGGSCLFL